MEESARRPRARETAWSRPLPGRPRRAPDSTWHEPCSPGPSQRARHDALPPRPHFKGAFHTATGGEILIVQYPGPSTGERPIYAGRFNMEKRKAAAEERVDL